MKYFIKKLITLIMTLFLVSVAAFLAFQIIPGDVVTSILGTEATPEREEQLREELGLNKPPVQRYFNWMTDVLQGDLGESYRYSKNMNEMMPVAELIGDKLPVTLWLAAVSLVLIISVSIPLGVLWARSSSRFLDAVLGVVTQTAMAVPSFFSGHTCDIFVWNSIETVCSRQLHKLSSGFCGIFKVPVVPGVVHSNP